MSKRLQVILGEEELRQFQAEARRDGMTLAEWVRQALRGRASASAAKEPGPKLAAIRAAARYEFPTADIDQMLDEIDQGRVDLP